MSYLNPRPRPGPILVTGIGEAEGARAAAAALACEGSSADCSALFIDVEGRPPRPTLLAAAPAQELERRISAHRAEARAAARGQVCHLAVAAEPDGLEVARAAMAIAGDGLSVVHLPPALLQPLLDGGLGRDPAGVLLRADLPADRALTALVARDLIARGLPVAVLKARLGWVSERRALFGLLPAGSGAALPERLVRRLLGASTGTAAIPAVGLAAAG